MISETSRQVSPWFGDRGVQASTAFTAFALAFNLVTADSPGEQVVGLLVVSPMLAAVLVERALRVWLALAIALAAFVLAALRIGMDWDTAELARLTSLLISAVIGFVAAQARIDAAGRLVALGEVAKTAQLAIMRMDPPKAEGVDAAVRYLSASTDARIGGDAYEALLTPFGLRVLVADARGKGLSAVLSSAVVLGAFREWAFVEEDLGELILRMDTSAARELDGVDFVTALVAEFAHDELQYVAAGHPAPVMMRGAEARVLDVTPAPPLSLIAAAGVSPEVGSLRVARDDVFLMFSDGLTDSRDVNGDFFLVRDSIMRVAAWAADVEECADGVLADLKDFVRGDLEDDVALVALRITKEVPPLPQPSDEQSLLLTPTPEPGQERSVVQHIRRDRHG